MVEDIEGTYGHIFAYGVMLSLLVEKVKESDPSFEDRSRHSFDSYLGQYFEKVGKVFPMEVAAREMFNAIISTSIGVTPQTGRIDIERPLTWKRRLFNWLEKG